MKIVTKHPLKEAIAEGAWAEVTNEAILNVEWKSGYVEQFRTTGKAQAFVGEVFPDGIRSLEKNIPDYGTQSKHYISGGQDLVLNGSVDKLGELKYNIIYHEEDNGDNPGWSEAGEMVITPRNYVFSDGVKGRNDVLISGAKDSDSTNKNLWNAAGQTQLDDGDYNFTSLEIIINEYDSVMVSEDENKKHWASPYPNNNLADYGNVIVSTRKAGSTDFSVLKTFLRSDLTALDDGGYKVSIDLPSDCVGYKVSYTSLRYSTEVKINTGLKLKNTTKIRTLTSEHVSAGKDTLIKNKAQVDIAREGFTTIVCDSTEFSPWRSTYELTLSESELWAAKSCLDQTKMSNDNKRKYFETDEVASTVEFPVAITGWTFSNNQIGSYKRVTSGTFHDLLPYGFVVDKSKIIVCGRTEEQASQRGSTTMNSQRSSANANSYSDSATVFPGIISSDYYSVRFEDNWEGSGQTMMIIDISCPDNMIATGFVVYYKCKTTINNLHINGTTPKNYVAFRDTTPNQGLPDTRKQPRLDDSTARSLFASVDNEQTAYCFGTTTLDTPNVYQYGADSNVHTEGAVMARHQVVGLNTDYTYHISYEGSTSTKTANLVIYDIIERQIGGKESEWYGEFNEVDISKIKQQPSNDAADGTCAPVVYYLSSDTIAKDAITEEMFDLDYEIEGNKIWTTEKPDNSKVVAIAVDCRKTSKNKDFVLGVRQGVDFTINMNSPAHSDRSEINTYNEAVIKGFNPEIGKNIKLYARTSVTLRFMNPVFVKSAYPASGTKDSPEPVVKDSTMDYVLSITNPDKELPMNNVIVEDEFPAELVPLNDYKVSFNDGDKIDIDGTRRVDYTLINKKDSEDKVVSRVFTATVDVLDPGEKVEITIPVKVGLQKDERITNKARITSINGVPYSELFSNETYHVVTGVKAKILKVNSKDEPLESATLKIYKNNETNFDDDGKLKADASPVMLNTGGEESVGSFTSTDKVMYFDIEPGSYVLVEDAIPVGTEYKPSANIPFTVDVYGVIKVNGERVNYVKMVDEPPFKIVFHENKPGGTPADKQKSFKVVEKMDLNALSRINAFTDVPDCAGDEYVFVGWYHDSEFTQSANPDSAESGANVKADFGETYSLRENVEDPDYHLYAKWVTYKVIFHDNKPGGTAAQRQNPFRTFNPSQLEEGKVPAFDDYPDCAGDKYQFDGWYHDSDYTKPADPDAVAVIQSSFNDEYAVPENDTEYHLYAKWTRIAPPDYMILFHHNRPEGTYNVNDTAHGKQEVFKAFDTTDLVDGMIPHFYDIPEWAEDDWVFAGWYHNADYRETQTPDNAANRAEYAGTAADFEHDGYLDPNRTEDYHLYAKWIEVGSVNREPGKDDNIIDSYRGFGLAGVQIRLPQMNDTNYEVVTPGGLRFVTSLSERLLSEIDAVSDKKVATYEGDVDVEYGYAVGTEESIAMFIDGVGINLDPPIEGHYKGVDLNKYRIQYNGKNVNGVDTSGTDAYGNRFKTDAYGNILTDANGQKIFACGHELTADNDYAYVYNINCTRGIAITDGNGSPTGVIKEDHRNCTDYRLYTLVVTYDGDSATRTSDRIDARSYIRYYDANGWLRVFYNDYENEDYFGGCMCSFDQISNMETPTYPSTHILDPED